ncbi:MAG: hypothetical protein AB1608_06925 [Thermoproteota archaeon]
MTEDDRRRIELLEIVSKKGLKGFNLSELLELKLLIEKKDYSHSKKAEKSKKKLLAQLNSRIYDLEEKRDL